MTQTASLHIKVENSGISATKEELERLTKAGQNAERATDGLNRAFKNIPKGGEAANNSLSKMRGIAGGLGYQLQDVAIQAQTGADKFVILGQQGSQIASMFGPRGAVLGAVIAVGAALIGAANKLTDTSGKVKELQEKALQLTDAFNISENGVLQYNERLQRLAATAPTVAAAIQRIKESQLELEQTLTSAALTDTLEGFDELSDILKNRATESFEQSKTSAMFMLSTMNNLSEEFGGTKEQIIAVTRALDDFKNNKSQDTAINLADALGELNSDSKEVNENISSAIALLGQYIETSELLKKTESPLKEQNKSVIAMVEALRLEAATLNKTSRERDLYIANLGKADEAQLAAINKAYDQIEAEQSKTAIERLQAQLLDEEARIDESYMRRREIIMANTIEGSEQQNELLRENWDKYEEEYAEFNNRLIAADEAAANRRELIESRSSKAIIREKQGVVTSALNLLTILASGNEKAAKAMLLVQAAANIALTIQNTAAAIMAAEKIDPTGALATAKAINGGIQIATIAANTALQLGGAGGSGGSPVSSSSSYGNPAKATPAIPTAPTESRREVVINFNGDVNGLDGEHIAKTLKDYMDSTDFILVDKV